LTYRFRFSLASSLTNIGFARYPVVLKAASRKAFDFAPSLDCGHEDIAPLVEHRNVSAGCSQGGRSVRQFGLHSSALMGN